MYMYSYCIFMYRHRASWHSSATMTEVFPCFFLSYKANARVKSAKTGHGPHSSKFLCFSLYCFYGSLVCKCVLYYCHRVATQLQLTNISYHIVYRIISCHIEATVFTLGDLPLNGHVACYTARNYEDLRIFLYLLFIVPPVLVQAISTLRSLLMSCRKCIQ